MTHTEAKPRNELVKCDHHFGIGVSFAHPAHHFFIRHAMVRLFETMQQPGRQRSPVILRKLGRLRREFFQFHGVQDIYRRLLSQ